MTSEAMRRLQALEREARRAAIAEEAERIAREDGLNVHELIAGAERLADLEAVIGFDGVLAMVAAECGCTVAELRRQAEPIGQGWRIG